MSGPLFIYRTTVAPTWIDYNGHMGDYAYGIVFSDAATSYMDRIGIDSVYRQTSGATLYTLDSRIGFLKECHADERLQVELIVIDVDHKRLHVFMRMRNQDDQETAFCEQLLMHVSRESGCPHAADMPQETREIIMADLQYSKTVERPGWLEKRIGLRRR